MIADFKEHDHINGQFLIGSVSRGVNASGAAYLNLELRDASGSINGKKWDVNPDDDNIYISGNVVLIDGEIIKYKDNLQMKIMSGELVDPAEVDAAKFVKAPPIPKEELIKRFNAHVDSIKDKDCRVILDYLIAKLSPQLYDYPAAVSVHHDYASGLLMHTISMADIGDYLANYYPHINRDLLMTGILLHDMGKCIEFEGPAVYKYSLKGKLLGHISIMASEVAEATEKLNLKGETPILLQHMVLSHHGQHEFGSPVLPLTKEALLLSLIDNIDSKMVCVEKNLETIKPGEFTQKIFALDNRMFYKPQK